MLISHRLYLPIYFTSLRFVASPAFASLLCCVVTYPDMFDGGSGIVLLLLFFLCTNAEQLRTRTLSPLTPPPGLKPFSGFTAAREWGSIDKRPATLEFLYIPINAVVTGKDMYDWSTVFEVALAAAAHQHRHVIVRFYLDYPGKVNGVPQYLIDAGLTMNMYTEYGGGTSVNYFDSNLIDFLVTFITNFGNKYDTDHRVGYVQCGVLGFWGEWHTYPHTNWFPTLPTQNRIFDAYISAFPTTMLLQRYPSSGGTSDRPRLGFFDDSFCYSTTSDKSLLAWYFWPTVMSVGQPEFWQIAAMGGELRPELQDKIFATDRSKYIVGDEKQPWNETVDVTHASWMLNNFAFSGTSDSDAEEKRVTNVAEQRMGYDYWIASLSTFMTAVTGVADENVEMMLIANVSNRGVAPFYYPLEMTVQLRPSMLTKTINVPSFILPGSQQVPLVTTFSMSREDVPTSSVAISLRCARCYTERPVLLGNAGTNWTTGVLEIKSTTLFHVSWQYEETVATSAATSVPSAPSSATSAAPSSATSAAPSSATLAAPSSTPSSTIRPIDTVRPDGEIDQADAFEDEGTKAAMSNGRKSQRMSRSLLQVLLFLLWEL